MTDELGLPFTVDIITCNPPWIPANFVRETNPLDNGVFDPEEKFLHSAFNFARLHLSKTGEMLMVYSDLAYQLGLQEES
jgi:methylase of polypeptide subunit release factors